MNHTVQILMNERKKLLDQYDRRKKLGAYYYDNAKKIYQEAKELEERIAEIDKDILDIKKSPLK